MAYMYEHVIKKPITLYTDLKKTNNMRLGR